MAIDKLNDFFLLELFKLQFRKKELIEICIKHLPYHYLPDESYKSIWKSIKEQYLTTQKIPTLGVIAQINSRNPNTISELNKIRELEAPDYDSVLEQLEEFIKQSKFKEGYTKLHDVFVNKEDKAKAYQLMKAFGEDINDFSIKKEVNRYEPVFGGYREREKERIVNKNSVEGDRNKVPFSIDELDEDTQGGCHKGDSFLFLAQSGVGKSTLARHIGVNTARRGMVVLHIQAEGSKEECMLAYDGTWKGQALYELEQCIVDPELQIKYEKVINDIVAGGGEIFVYSPGKFDSITMRDIRDIALEIIQKVGRLDLILLDYLELVDPGDGKLYRPSEERARRESLAEKTKNIASELNVVFGTFTQASTVDPLQLNDPNFVQTRYHISEFKGVIKPFSYFFTLNQTLDEYENNMIRIYYDKIRKYKSHKTVTIFTAYQYNRFYDRVKTLTTLKEEK